MSNIVTIDNVEYNVEDLPNQVIVILNQLSRLNESMDQAKMTIFEIETLTREYTKLLKEAMDEHNAS